MYFLPNHNHQVGGGLGSVGKAGKNLTGSIGDITGSLSKQFDNLGSLGKIDIPTGSLDDISGQIKVGSKLDDIGDVAGTVSKQADDLSDVAGSVSRQADDLGDLTGDVAGRIKNIDTGSDLTGDVAKQVNEASDVAGDVAKKADLGKGADDLAETAGDNVDDLAKKLDDNADEIGGAVGEEGAKSAKKKMIDFIKKNPKTLAGGVAAATIAGVALGLFLKFNDTEFIITKMEKASGDTLTLTYKLEGEDVDEDDYFDFKTYDKIKVTENDAVPKVADRIYNITEVDNEGKKVTISVPKELMPTTMAKTGKFLYKTDFANSLRRTAEEITKSATDAATGAGKGIFEGFTKGLADALGIDPKNMKWILFGIVAFIVLMIVGGIAMKFM